MAALSLLIIVCLLAALLVVVLRGGPMLHWDLRTIQWVHYHQIPPVLGIMDWVGATAEAPVALTALVVVGASVTLARHQWWPLATAVGAAVALVALVSLGRHVVRVVHVELHPDVGSRTGFPAGHPATAVVVLGTMILLLLADGPATARRAALVLLVLYAGLVGFARLYVQAHRLSEVVGGWLLGSLIVMALALLTAQRLGPKTADPAAEA